MTVLCACGCGEPAPIADRHDKPRGYVKGWPRRYVKGHHGRRGPFDFEVRNAGYTTPCWMWLRSVNQGGYGMTRDGKYMTAHRAYYIRAKGPVPDALQLDHLCRNKTCVNPDHLEPVTAQVNTTRMHLAKSLPGTPLRDVRRRLVVSQRQLAERLGVTQSSVSRWERGTRTIPAWVWERIEFVSGVNRFEMFVITRAQRETGG